MKKSTILSLATAGAIVATSAFTFAAWDKTEDTATTTLTYRSPVKITQTLTDPTAKDYNLGEEAPEVSVTTTFAVDDTDTKASSLTVTPTLKDAKGGNLGTDKVTIQVKEGSEVLPGGKDDSVSASNVYTIVVTPTSAATYEDLNNAELTVVGTLQ